jgi:ATP-dependent Clp protease protease subunit
MITPQFLSPTPAIVESDGRVERVFDVFSRLYKERIIILGAAINDAVANNVVAHLLHLDHEDPTKPISLYLSSPGGGIYAGMAIYDTMQQIRAPISTIAIGFTASFGTVLLTAGTDGYRYALPNATIHLHQPLGGTQGQASDIEIQAKEILRLRTKLNDILSFHTGQPVEKIADDTERDYYMTAQEAMEYGLIDEVLEPPEKEAKNETEGE